MDPDKLAGEASEYVRGIKEGGEIVRREMEARIEVEYQRGVAKGRRSHIRYQWAKLFGGMFLVCFMAAFLAWVAGGIVSSMIGA
jgi:hypothetical protein